MINDKKTNKCGKCGGNLEDGYKICPYCGENLNKKYDDPDSVIAESLVEIEMSKEKLKKKEMLKNVKIEMTLGRFLLLVGVAFYGLGSVFAIVQMFILFFTY